jgi:eukaryotic-like serine/threonine-protein kinase
MTKAGRYELLEELGHGAMGVVYHAKDPVIGRDVAVKTIRLVQAGGGMSREELSERFKTEAHAAGLLSHPNIVVIYDAGEEDGQFYIIMEMIEGESIQALLDHGQSFPLPRVLRLIDQACSALEFAHQRSVVHRDIKPANLMLTQDDQLKITDFGTAKILEMGASQTATVIGTPSYMSPEQIKGSAVDGRSDIFALGVILYELVTGQKPFPGENVTTVIYRIVNEEPIPPRQIDASIHPGLAAVIERALAKDPEDRFQSCREMSHALKNYSQLHQSTASTPTVRLPSTAPFPAISAPSGYGQSGYAQSAYGPAGYRAVAPRFVPASVPAVPRAVVPPRMRTGPVGWPQPERKRNRHIMLALALLALIAVAGYHIWPVLSDFWHTGVEPAFASHLAPIERDLHIAQPVPEPSPAITPTAPRPPIGKTASTRSSGATKPFSTPASAASDAPAANGAPPTDRADSDPKPTAAASVVEKHLDAFLAGAGLASAVQIHSAGDTLTLSGTLTPDQYQSLLRNLRDLPADVRIVDNIEYGTDSPQASVSPAPATATPAPSRASTPAPVPVAATPSLTVTSRPPGANIFVNGQRQFTQTPAKIDLPPGAYRIAVTKPGFEPYATQVEIQAGKPAQLDAQLPPLAQGQGWVEARTVPKGALITVDGVLVQQQTPARLDLAAGQHLIVFSLAGYTAETSVVVRAGKGSQIFQVLSRP